MITLAILLFSYYSFLNIGLIPSAFLGIMPYISYVFLFIAMVLSLRFNKSRIFFISVILTASQISLMYYKGTQELMLFYFITLLIPINVLLFSFFKERGILTVWGILKIGLIMGQMAFVYSYIETSIQVDEFFQYEFFRSQAIDVLGMPQISILAFLIVLICFLIRQTLKPSFLEVASMGVVLTVLLGFILKEQQMALPIFFAGAGLSLIVGVIQNTYSMAYLDELTGLPARRALRENMLKLGNKYVITMLDIDFFKKFNDRYGHDIGDEVLKLVASNLKTIGGGGKAFRYGGEEFTLLFPNKKIDDVMSHLEELRERVAKTGYTYYGKKKSNKSKKTKSTPKQLYVTISLGVAEKKAQFKTPDEVMKAADTALYRAKKKGRNCVSK
jgi:diguanylate cyclase (GGDEF)-like protein